MDETTTTTNGSARGRPIPALPQHTFQDSGVTIGIRKIGPATQQRFAQQILREHPEPQPPIVTTELGDERNPADPDYIAKRQQWQQETAMRLNDQLLTLAALEAEVLIGEDERREIARKRRYLDAVGMTVADNPKLDQEENDRIFYILHIACQSAEDLGEFGRVVMSRSLPAEAAVQEHIDTFPGDV